MKFIIFSLILVLSGCDQDCSDRTRSDLDYCNCHPENCQPGTYQPEDYNVQFSLNPHIH